MGRGLRGVVPGVALPPDGAAAPSALPHTGLLTRTRQNGVMPSPPRSCRGLLSRAPRRWAGDSSRWVREGDVSVDHQPG